MTDQHKLGVVRKTPRNSRVSSFNELGIKTNLVRLESLGNQFGKLSKRLDKYKFKRYSRGDGKSYRFKTSFSFSLANMNKD